MKQLIIVLCLFPLLLCSGEAPRTGTLIVTYQTDHKGERLDRIRFWLKNEHRKQTLYPRGSTFVDDTENNTRMVVIKNLTPGHYTLEFLVPNIDGRFEKVPNRKVKIAKGDVVKIDQEIKTRRGQWRNKPKVAKNILEKRVHRPFTTKPPTKETPLVEVERQGPVVTAAPPVEEKKATTSDGFGKLIVSFELKQDPKLAENIRFRLIDETGKTTIHPTSIDTEVPLNAGKMVMIQLLKAGSYRLEFVIDGNNQTFPSKTFEIQKNRTKSIHQSIQINQKKVPIVETPTLSTTTKIEVPSTISQRECGLTLTANIPTAVFNLLHKETYEEFEGEGREYSFEDLKPGKYLITFSSSDPFFVPPEQQEIALVMGEPQQKVVLFQTLGKVKLSTNIPHATANITPMEVGNPAYKKEVIGGNVAVYLPEGNYRITFKEVVDRKAPDPVDVKVHPLQTEEVNAYFL